MLDSVISLLCLFSAGSFVLFVFGVLLDRRMARDAARERGEDVD